jgi:hypothetical protein
VLSAGLALTRCSYQSRPDPAYAAQRLAWLHAWASHYVRRASQHVAMAPQCPISYS